VNVNDMVLVQGMADTRASLRRWWRDPGAVLRPWLALSVAVALTLLLAVWVISLLSTPDPTPLFLPGVHFDPTPMNVVRVLYRNSLVLALHAMACVAGFIAGSSLPQQIEHKTGISRTIHQHAGPLAIGFVVLATTFSLVTQAYVLGGGAATLSYELGIPRGILLLALLPHALPELVALFLPLAAWLIASRRGAWDELLAATFATVAVAVPVLIVSALVEIYVTPNLLIALSS
jgi:Stage II sporulation protein M